MTLDIPHFIMIIISLVLLYLGIVKKYEPLLLVPIAFGMLLVNLPLTGMMQEAFNGQPAGLLRYFYKGASLSIFPPLIFMGIGAMIDFGPLISDPKGLLLGAAAQIGVFITFLGAILLGFTGQEAASIGIIGGANGPAVIYVASNLAPKMLGAIAIAAYSYMALVPVIQPPLINLVTTKKERTTKMKQLRPVSKSEKIILPIAVTIIVIIILPEAGPLIGMLMLGNLFRESGVVDRLSDTAQNSLINILTILLGLAVGGSATADKFLRIDTIQILILGVIAFAIGTLSGLLVGKLMYKLTDGKVNPMIGAAGVAAVPMSARVVQKEGQKADSSNYLLMHAMGPNVAGAIGSAVAAGVMMSIFA
ncbi:MAG: sodium ion-translocating decarboxylase subunit beta [Halanaerobiales bacterium]|nr:sodium ion-translocating decarboxylase subunit beta [Halanaerobiales bacterium]